MLNSFGTTHRFLVQNLITKHKFSNTIPQSIVVIFHFIVIFQLIFVALDFSVEGGGVVYFLDWGLWSGDVWEWELRVRGCLGIVGSVVFEDVLGWFLQFVPQLLYYV